ncbi:MAG: type II secretion system protein GspL [Thermodesulfobacteriota bacterium]
MSRKILGLDIKENAVSAVLVRGGIKGNSIEEHRHIPLPLDQDKEESLMRALETIAAEMNIEGATCVASLPACLASYRNMEAPFKEPKKLRQILPYELESILPYPPENVITDFNVLHLTEDTENHLVLTASLQKESVGFYLDRLKSHGIEPDVLTIDGYALACTLTAYSNDNANRLLASIEPDRATLFLMIDGNICLARSLSVKAASEAGVGQFCSIVQQTLAGFQKQTGLENDLQEVLLSGSALEDPQIENAIRQELGIPVRTLDLISLSGQVSIETEGIMWKVSTMDASLALALSAILGIDLLNFRRGGFAVEKGWVQYQGDILKTGLIALLVALIFSANFVTDYYYIKKRSMQVEEEVRKVFTSTFPDVKRIVDPLQQMRVKLQEIKKGATFSIETNRSVLAIDVLNDISRHIPKQIDVALSSIIIGADNVLISGDTGGFDAVDDVKSSLENAALFKNVSITSTNKERSGNRVRFKIKAVI